MPNKSTIARPYAKAAVAAANDRLAPWSEALRCAARALADPRVAGLLHDPRVQSEQLAELVAAAAGPSLEPTQRNFIRLLADNHRLDCLPEISQRFAELEAQAEGTIDVEVSSACALSETQQRMLAAALERRLRRTVRLRCVHDPALIGGARVRAGDLVIDGSLRGRLERVARQLTA
jgi:F-type H+-transporting ATPase subunit delta